MYFISSIHFYQKFSSLSSIDEYLSDPKRFCANGCASNGLCNQPTEERIDTLFGYLKNASFDTVPEYIPDLCHELVKHGREDGLKDLLEMVKGTPIGDRDPIYDYILQALLQVESSYSKALKRLANAIYGLGTPTDRCMNYIVRKIFSAENEDIGAFLDELKKLCAKGYKLNATMINKLMVHCTDNFDVPLHQFVLTRIVNKLSKSELDTLNETILKKFVDRKMEHIKHQRVGLSRKRWFQALQLQLKKNYRSLKNTQEFLFGFPFSHFSQLKLFLSDENERKRKKVGLSFDLIANFMSINNSEPVSLCIRSLLSSMSI